MTLVVASVITLSSLGYALHLRSRCSTLSRATHAEDDELELRLAERALKLELTLARRVVQALARATLFSGTGLAVWELTGGSAHYLQAGGAFLLGFVGWAGCGEVQRRMGPMAGSRPARKPTR